MTFATVHAIRTNKQTKMCDSQIMRQKNETMIINEEPKGEVARREQSKEWMMGGWMDWMVWISCARSQGIHTTMVRGKRRVGITLLRKRDGIVRRSTPEVKEIYLTQPVLLGYGLSHLAFGPSASAAGARAVLAPSVSSPRSAVVAR